jgi:UDP-glucose 4-epimerase
MKKILITGCSGYIGSHLCSILSKEHEVHGLDIVEPKAMVHKFYHHDINQMFAITDQTEPYDVIIHLAALVNVTDSQANPIMYYITNLNGTMNVINKIPCKNFIFASTGAAESCESVYAVSKRAAEDVIREYYTVHNPTPHTIFRFYNVIGTSGYGPTNTDGLMASLMRSVDKGEFTIYGNDYDTVDGTCVRDYIHVDEICNALIKAIDDPSNSIECLGHGKGRSVLEMFYLFKLVNNLNIKLNFGPRRSGDPAISVLSEVSRFMEPLYKFEDFLKLG